MIFGNTFDGTHRLFNRTGNDHIDDDARRFQIRTWIIVPMFRDDLEETLQSVIEWMCDKSLDKMCSAPVLRTLYNGRQEIFIRCSIDVAEKLVLCRDIRRLDPCNNSSIRGSTNV